MTKLAASNGVGPMMRQQILWVSIKFIEIEAKGHLERTGL
jgi:hypothetical protein